MPINDHIDLHYQYGPLRNVPHKGQAHVASFFPHTVHHSPRGLGRSCAELFSSPRWQPLAPVACSATSRVGSRTVDPLCLLTVRFID
jgi:hypothetical protein